MHGRDSSRRINSKLLNHLPDHLRAPAEIAYITGWRIHDELLTRHRHHLDLNAGGFVSTVCEWCASIRANGVLLITYKRNAEASKADKLSTKSVGSYQWVKRYGSNYVITADEPARDVCRSLKLKMKVDRRIGYAASRNN